MKQINDPYWGNSHTMKKKVAGKEIFFLSNNKYANAGGGGYVSEGLLFYVKK